MDMNDNGGLINTLDVLLYIPVLNTSAVTGDPNTFKWRQDLNADGTNNTIDVLKFIPALNQPCT